MLLCKGTRTEVFFSLCLTENDTVSWLPHCGFVPLGKPSMSSQHRVVGDPKHFTEEDVFTRFAKSITVKSSYGIPKAIKKTLVPSAFSSYSDISNPYEWSRDPNAPYNGHGLCWSTCPLVEPSQRNVTFLILPFSPLSIQAKCDANTAGDTRGITGKLLSGYSIYFLWKFMNIVLCLFKLTELRSSRQSRTGKLQPKISSWVLSENQERKKVTELKTRLLEAKLFFVYMHLSIFLTSNLFSQLMVPRPAMKTSQEQRGGKLLTHCESIFSSQWNI